MTTKEFRDNWKRKNNIPTWNILPEYKEAECDAFCLADDLKSEFDIVE